MYKNNRFGRRGNVRRGGQFNGQFSKRPISRGSRFAAKQLDTRLFVRPAEDVKIEEVVIENKFSDFKLHKQLQNNLLDKGFLTPTPIQDKALAKAIDGKDLIGLADTGTGKTLAFILPIINRMIANPSETALIIAPTRELAVQIKDEVRSLTNNISVYSCLLIGGADMRRQVNELRRRPHIYIGTPGRLKDLHERGVLNLNRTSVVVLDEMDRMLDMGFVKDVSTLLAFLPKERQTLLFSATIDDRVEGIAKKFMNNPEKISVKTGSTSQNVDQSIVKVNGSKIETLHELLVKSEFTKVLIFGRTKHGVEKLSQDLIKKGFTVGAIHGNKRQSQRQNVLKLFKSNQLDILVATDVAARGVDVKDISHVINFDQPATYEDYVHRIGRTGRAGKKGFAITFVD